MCVNKIAPKLSQINMKEFVVAPYLAGTNNRLTVNIIKIGIPELKL